MKSLSLLGPDFAVFGDKDVSLPPGGGGTFHMGDLFPASRITEKRVRGSFLH